MAEKKQEFKAIIFDLDGVIVRTDRFHFNAWKAVADELGISFNEEDNHRLRGISRMDSLKLILEKYKGKEFTDDEKKTLAEKKNDIYKTQLLNMQPTDVSDEVRKTLGELKKIGYKIAIGSSSKNAMIILERVKLLDIFDAISDGNNIEKSKPDPEVFLKAAEYLGIKPDQCIVVEDAEAGIEAGIAAKMSTAAIGPVRSCGKAEYVLNSLSELINILT